MRLYAVFADFQPAEKLAHILHIIIHHQRRKEVRRREEGKGLLSRREHLRQLQAGANVAHRRRPEQGRSNLQRRRPLNNPAQSRLSKSRKNQGQRITRLDKSEPCA